MPLGLYKVSIWASSFSFDPQCLSFYVLAYCIYFHCCCFNVFCIIQVTSRVCELMQIPSLEAGGIKLWRTQALKDLQYTMREVNMFIEVGKHAICLHWFLIYLFGCYRNPFSPLCVSVLNQWHPSAPCMSWASHWQAWRTRNTMRSWIWGRSANSPSSTGCSRSTVIQRTMISTRLRQ